MIVDPFVVQQTLSYIVPAAVMIAIGYPLARAVGHRIMTPRSSKAALPNDLAQRLERIESAVESVAVEVERISEAQRFALKIGEKPTSLPPGSNR